MIWDFGRSTEMSEATLCTLPHSTTVYPHWTGLQDNVGPAETKEESSPRGGSERRSICPARSYRPTPSSADDHQPQWTINDIQRISS